MRSVYAMPEIGPGALSRLDNYSTLKAAFPALCRYFEDKQDTWKPETSMGGPSLLQCLWRPVSYRAIAWTLSLKLTIYSQASSPPWMQLFRSTSPSASQPTPPEREQTFVSP